MTVEENNTATRAPVFTAGYDGIYALVSLRDSPGGGAFYLNEDESSFMGLSQPQVSSVYYLSSGDVVSYIGPACELNVVRLGLDF